MTSFPAVNYEDPNLNVGIPVFSIHGNHDDPQGTGPVRSTCFAELANSLTRHRKGLSVLWTFFPSLESSITSGNLTSRPMTL